MNSCIYKGTVKHRRATPVHHEFDYPVFMMYMDLEELPRLFEGRWLWSASKPAPACFRRADYLGDPDTSLDEAVRAEAERLTGHRPAGPVRVLTHLRYFGYVMNPVSFYYCFTAGGEAVDTVLAEITNTPWKERHTYALRSEGVGAGACDRTHSFDKAFHISPFMPMEQRYEWRLTQPGPRLFVHMKNRSESEGVFDATLDLVREEISGRALASALVSYPWMTARVAAGIYWQAFRLWLKRTPYHDHPNRRAA